VVVLKCLGLAEGNRFLDGNTGSATVGLAPNTELPFTGTHWLVVDVRGPTELVLKCLGHVEGNRFLDGNTALAATGLAPNTDRPFTGTRWEAIDTAPGFFHLRCLGDLEGPRFLDGNTSAGTVGLAPHTDPPFTGTRWEVLDLGPAALPDFLSFETGPIVFAEGIPVGGFAHLTVRRNGSFSFRGHFHNSGAVDFNVSMAWGLKDVGNQLFTFQTSGEMAGTFGPGSRDHDWNDEGNHEALAQRWTALAAGATTTWRAETDVDIFNVTNAMIGAAGLVIGVVALVVA
jgi:hypothetical protein